ncbi:hypothetical protein [Accumulibacter sp.]|uniref:DUF6969 family protein n=1 Tax=Accumulibacter sp. TaxID=2053492 RepID=UPI0026303B7B|nr:hypothetical protein [Accumulibacter sp.]
MTFAPVLDSLSPQRRSRMLAAGHEVRECYRVLEKAGINIVGEILRGQGEFIELEHYPRDDVFDGDSGGQYYYHAHRNAELEHGHFHLFLRAAGMPAGCRVLDYPQASDAWPSGDDAICHLVAIAMNSWGYPVGLFCTNRWVTAEAWYPAEQVITMLDRFAIDHAFPNWAVNRWLTAMLQLFRPHVECLIRQRDQLVADWQSRQPHADIFEDRNLEIISQLPIDVDALIRELEAMAAR